VSLEKTACYYLILFVCMQINPKAAESLADPSEYPNLFEDWQVALTVEKSVASQRYTVSHKLLHFVLEYCLPEVKKIH
jgi:hypothetical protein